MRIVIKPAGILLIALSIFGLAYVAVRTTMAQHAATDSTIVQFSPPAANAALNTSAAPAATVLLDKPPPITAPADTIIYDGKFHGKWTGTGWAKKLDTAYQMPGVGTVAKVPTTNFEAVYFYHDAFVPKDFDRVTFWVSGGETGGQSVKVSVRLPGAANSLYDRTLPKLPANKWMPWTMRLKDYGVYGKQRMLGFWVQSTMKDPQPPYYVTGARILRPGDPDPAAAH